MATRKRDDTDRAHLREVEDGCGCTEIWEHLSETRESPVRESDD
jgi:hypothetical protein